MGGCLASSFGAGGVTGITRSTGGVGASAFGIGGSSSSARGRVDGAVTVTATATVGLDCAFGVVLARCSDFTGIDSGFGMGKTSAGTRCTSRATNCVLLSRTACALGTRQPKLLPPS